MKNCIKGILAIVAVLFVVGSVGGLECNTLSMGQALRFASLGAGILIFDLWLYYKWW